MSKSQVGRVFLSHTFSKKKVWTTNFEVGRSAMDVHTFINLWWLAVVWKWYVLFEVIPNESLDFKASLIKSVSKYLNRNTLGFSSCIKGETSKKRYQIPVKIKNSIANFRSKMSKLFGQVGRVDRRILVQIHLCPYQATRQVGYT